MADDEQLRILKQGVEAWNKWCVSNPKIRANLRYAKLARADLTGANLTEAHLADADLTGAVLWEANLTEAHLAGANLAGADLKDAKLTRARLPGANLAGASLWRANLTGAKLRDAYNLTQDQLDFACISKSGAPPALPRVLQPPHNVCEP